MVADTPIDAGKFPPGIAKAVIQVMKEVGTLGKTHERNDSGARYMFASVDDFYEHVRDHMANAGLFIIPNEARDAETQEVTRSNGKPMVVWSARFAFTLVHESGECYGPIYKSVSVQFSGATSSGASQSYAEKQLLRGLFKIKTGEADDPDNERLEVASKGDTQTDMQKLANGIRKKIRNASDLSELGLTWSDSDMDLALIKGVSDVAYDALEKEYHTRKKELEDA